MDRRSRLLSSLGDMAGLGLEIGALHHPVVERSQANVLYVDHADTETLRAKYATHDDVRDIVDVDVVWGDGSLSDALGERGPIDWVVASHVIEHVPDLVQWLDELASVMRDGAHLCLAIPDKRYCFDIGRRETDPAEVVGAWLAHHRRPPLGTVYEFYARIREVDAARAWAGDYAMTPVDDNVEQGLDWARRAAATDEYFDVHCWAFTPPSFAATLRTLFRLGLTSFRPVASTPTAPDDLEFFCTLERLPRTLDDAERQREQLAALDRLMATPDDADDHRLMLVSEREARLIDAKRHAMQSARRVAQSIIPKRAQ